MADGAIWMDLAPLKEERKETEALRNSLDGLGRSARKLGSELSSAFQAGEAETFREQTEAALDELMNRWEAGTKLLSGRVSTLLDTIGQSLAILLTPAVEMLGRIAEAALSAAGTVRDALAALFGMGTGAREVEEAEESSVKNQNALTKAVKRTGKEQKKTLASFDSLNRLNFNTGGSTGTSTGAAQTESGTAKESLLEMAARWGETLTPLREALKRLQEALAPFASNVGQGLRWFYDNVLSPLGAWAGNELLPRFLDLLTIMLEGLNNAVEAVKPGAQWLWDNFLQPVGQWAGEVFIAALDVVIGLFELLAGVLTGDVQMAMEGVSRATEGLQSLWNSWVSVFETVKEAALAAAGAIEGKLLAFVSWVNETVVQPVAGFFSGLWSGISERAQAAWDMVKSVFQGAAEWFNANLIQPVQDGFRGLVNGIIGFFEGLANGVVKVVNTIVGALNRLSFTLPDWVPGIGGKQFGLNLPTVGEVRIPRLASGAVIPANREFLAVLGDQKSGTNVEAPLSVIEEAVERAMERSGGGAGRELTLRLEAGRGFVRELKLELDEESRRRGVNLVRGAAV